MYSLLKFVVGCYVFSKVIDLADAVYQKVEDKLSSAN